MNEVPLAQLVGVTVDICPRGQAAMLWAYPPGNQGSSVTYNTPAEGSNLDKTPNSIFDRSAQDNNSTFIGAQQTIPIVAPTLLRLRTHHYFLRSHFSSTLYNSV